MFKIQLDSEPLTDKNHAELMFWSLGDHDE